ncbi:MAG TPA: hypothetical protein VGJ11_04220 [Gaiellales bacterium]|jgi:hypothetical protein
MVLLARLVRFVTAAVVLVLVAGIVLHLLKANGSNGIVSTVYDVDTWLGSPFKNVFSPKDPNVKIAVNWGLAALVYAIVGWVISALLIRAGAAGRGAWLRRRRGAEPV